RHAASRAWIGPYARPGLVGRWGPVDRPCGIGGLLILWPLGRCQTGWVIPSVGDVPELAMAGKCDDRGSEPYSAGRGKLAVDGLDLIVQPGIVTGLLGPNGAGKSTTMRPIAGLNEPPADRVPVNGGGRHRRGPRLAVRRRTVAGVHPPPRHHTPAPTASGA